ncbi:MAG: nuclease-related domain-containing protein [Actinomycetota bacterium]
MEARSPAQFLRHRLRLMSLTAVLFVAEAFLLALAGFWWWPLSVIALVPVYLLARATVLGGPLDPVALRSGIRGEVRVAGLLAELEPDGYRVLHDVDLGRGNADHVLIGPAGVFVIETKDWGGRFYPRRGRLMFNNRRADDVVGQVTTAALEIRRRLELAGIDVWVQAVIASTRAKVSASPIRLGHITAVDASGLPAFVRGRKATLDATTADGVVAALLRDAA